MIKQIFYSKLLIFFCINFLHCSFLDNSKLMQTIDDESFDSQKIPNKSFINDQHINTTFIDEEDEYESDNRIDLNKNADNSYFINKLNHSNYIEKLKKEKIRLQLKIESKKDEIYKCEIERIKYRDINKYAKFLQYELTGNNCQKCLSFSSKCCDDIQLNTVLFCFNCKSKIRRNICKLCKQEKNEVLERRETTRKNNLKEAIKFKGHPGNRTKQLNYSKCYWWYPGCSIGGAIGLFFCPLWIAIPLPLTFSFLDYYRSNDFLRSHSSRSLTSNDYFFNDLINNEKEKPSNIEIFDTDDDNEVELVVRD